MFTKQVSRSIVAAKAEQFERTRRKAWSSSRSEVFVPYRLGIPNARLEIIERAFILGPEIGRLSP
jgi:hypothetical protein